MHLFFTIALLGIAQSIITTAPAHANGDGFFPDFSSCTPYSEYSRDRVDAPVLAGVSVLNEGRALASLTTGFIPTVDFCSEWNPEYAFNGHRCCRRIPAGKKNIRKNRVSCFTKRPRVGYCGEITPEQQEYTEWASSGKLGDLLSFLTLEMKSGRNSLQAFCTVNNGFLANGRRLIPTAQNRIKLRTPERCTEFGTDPMVAMLEWLGRQVAEEYKAPEYSGVHMVVGDIAAPRGGCLAGPSGVRGHRSHTNGTDVDITFLQAIPGRQSEVSFHRNFDGKSNWWFAKQMLKNPYACVKVIFLDKKLIQKLGKAAHKAGEGAEFEKYRRFFRSVPGHKNHFHVRVGDWPGEPGCVKDASPELELEESDGDEYDGGETFMIPEGPDAGEPAPAEAITDSR